MQPRIGSLQRALIATVVVVIASSSFMRVVGLDRPAPYRAFVDPWGRDGLPTVRGFMSPEDSAASLLLVGDRVARVGEIDLDDTGQLGFLAAVSQAAWETDGPVPFLIERAGERLTVLEERPAAPRAGYVAGLWVALLYGVIALLVAARAPPTLNNRLLFLFMALYGLSNINMLDGPAVVFWYSVGLSGLSLATMPLILLAMLGMPPEVDGLRGRNLVWPWIFVPVGAMQYVERLAFPFAPAIAGTITNLTFPIFILVVMAVLASNYRKSGPAGRRQVKWAMLGVYTGSVIALVGIAMYGWLPSDPPPLWVVIYLASNLPFPLALFIAVSRFDMLDVDRFIGAAVAYNVLGVIVIGAGLVAFPPLIELLTASLQVEPAVGRTSLAFGTAAVVVVAQKRLSPHVDRVFFRERYALDQAMKDVPERLALARGPDDLWSIVGRDLVDVLRPGACVIFTRGSGTFAPQFAEGGVALQGIDASADFVEWVGELTGAVRLDRHDTKGVGSLGRAVFGSLATQVVVPVKRGGTMEGFICLSEKRSGDIYTRTDLTLLTSLSKNMSVHLMRFTDAELLEQTRTIQEKMRRYVPGALAREIELGRELETGEREVSVLFVDIRGYTAYSERREAPDVFSTINRYTEAVSTIVLESGGVVVEFNGDGMMAVFGAPRRLADKERAAVQAACRLVEDVPLVGEDERVDVGVGIATGIAYVGNIQAADRTIWSALGKTTNLAARLQSLTREHDVAVLIDGLTYQRAGEAATDFLERRGVEIRGRSAVETLYGFSSQAD